MGQNVSETSPPRLEIPKDVQQKGLVRNYPVDYLMKLILLFQTLKSQLDVTFGLETGPTMRSSARRDRRTTPPELGQPKSFAPLCEGKRQRKQERFGDSLRRTPISHRKRVTDYQGLNYSSNRRFRGKAKGCADSRGVG